MFNKMHSNSHSDKVWVYVQKTGKIYSLGENGSLTYHGLAYSGHGKGLNEPSLQTKKNVGPIPEGKWIMTGMHYDKHTGPHTIFLAPARGTKTFGRTLFRIHGDNAEHNHSASRGCIVISPASKRTSMWRGGDHTLIVVKNHKALIDLQKEQKSHHTASKKSIAG